MRAKATSYEIYLKLKVVNFIKSIRLNQYVNNIRVLSYKHLELRVVHVPIRICLSEYRHDLRVEIHCDSGWLGRFIRISLDSKFTATLWST